jgi:hypothetical protein
MPSVQREDKSTQHFEMTSRVNCFGTQYAVMRGTARKSLSLHCSISCVVVNISDIVFSRRWVQRFSASAAAIAGYKIGNLPTLDDAAGIRIYG